MEEPIDAEVVREPTKAIAVKSSKSTKSYHDVAVVTDGVRKRIRVSDRERKFLNMFLKIGNIRLACAEVGLSEKSGKRYVQRPHIKLYIEMMRERAAHAADLTVDKVAAVMSRGVDGEELTQSQQKMVIAASRFLRPAGTNITVNTQNNINTSASPFEKVSHEEMIKTLRENLLDSDDED